MSAAIKARNLFSWTLKLCQMSIAEMIWNVWVGFFYFFNFLTESWKEYFSLGHLWGVGTWLSSSANAVYISA